jgi:hypothetical protein
MVDPETLGSVLGNLRGYLAKLSILAAFPEAEFVADFAN